MRRAAHIGGDVAGTAASQNGELKPDRSQVGHLETVLDVNLVDLSADRREQVRGARIGNVGAAALEETTQERVADSAVVVAALVDHVRIIERQALDPDPRARLGKPAAHRRVHRPGQLVRLNERRRKTAVYSALGGE